MRASGILIDKEKELSINRRFELPQTWRYYFMRFGPRDRNNQELTENEELEILEAYQSADEYLDMGGGMDDFYFESEE